MVKAVAKVVQAVKAVGNRDRLYLAQQDTPTAVQGRPIGWKGKHRAS